MLIKPRALKSQKNIEKIQLKMMVATFNGNPCATIISCYIPMNVSEETELIVFYNALSSLFCSIPKHNVLVIGGDIRYKCALSLRKKFKTETHTPNDDYENFVNALLKAAAEGITTQQRDKPSVPWDSLAVRKKSEYCFQMQ